MGKSDREQFAALVQSGISRGLDVVDAWRVARDNRPSRQTREWEMQRQRAIAAHDRSVRKFERRKSRLRTQSIAGTAVAGVAGTVGVIDVVSEAVTSQAGVYGPSWMWLGAAIIGAVSALTARRTSAQLPSPAAVAAIPGPPPPLPTDAIGAHEAAYLTRLRVQLSTVLPQIEYLQPAAAEELRAADAEAAPPLHSLIERLAALDRMQRELEGTTAGDSARRAAIEVRDRLATGASTYEQLLSASAALLAAPDSARSTSEVLLPAIEALTAYAHGLQRSADTYRN
jgi:hypothetical protein